MPSCWAARAGPEHHRHDRHLALAHVRQGQVDAAAGALHQAIDMAALTRGAGGLNLIFKATRELAPWRQEAAVQYVHDRVHDLMTAP